MVSYYTVCLTLAKQEKRPQSKDECSGYFNMSIKSVSRCCGKERFDKNLLSDPDPGVTSGDGEPIFRCNQFPASGVPRLPN